MARKRVVDGRSAGAEPDPANRLLGPAPQPASPPRLGGEWTATGRELLPDLGVEIRQTLRGTPLAAATGQNLGAWGVFGCTGGC